MATGWDAFISYSHADSERTAIALQRGLERFARPWYQRRAIRVFRDNSALSTNPGLWPAIEQGLASAAHLIVLTSPTAAASPYVDRETAWWVAHKGAESILLVRDAGALEWSPSGRFSENSAVTPTLRTAFADEPRWLDLRWLRDSANPGTDPRFIEAIADLSAPIRGVPRDELIGEDLVQHRRVRRLTRAAVAGLTLLLITSIVAAAIAVRQRDDVLRQAVTLRSRQLAGLGTQTLRSDLGAGQLLAVQSYLTENSAVSRSAVLEASLAAPVVQHLTTFGAPVTALAAGGGIVAVGLEDGRVFTLATQAAAQPVLRWTAPSAVTDVRVADNGAVLLVRAAGVPTLIDGDGSRALRGVPAGDGALALSPSGRRAAVLVDRGGTSPRITVFDNRSGDPVARHTDPLAPSERMIVYPQYTAAMTFLDDASLRLVGNDNRWLTLAVASGRVARRGVPRGTPTSTCTTPPAGPGTCWQPRSRPGSGCRCGRSTGSATTARRTRPPPSN